MTITGLRALQLALIPGLAEGLEERADLQYNFEMKQITQEIKVTRNVLYFTLVTAIIGIAAVELSSEPRTSFQLAGRRFINGCAVGFACKSAQKLYQAVQRAAAHL